VKTVSKSVVITGSADLIGPESAPIGNRFFDDES